VAPPSLGEGSSERERLVRAQLVSSVPAVLLFVGAAYVALSGTVFFFGLSSARAGLLWGITALTGLVVLAGALRMRDAPWPDRTLHVVDACLAGLVLLHGVGFLWATRDPGQAPWILVLLLGAGTVLLSPWALAAVDAVTLAAWVLAADSIGQPVLSPPGTPGVSAGQFIVGGMLLGALAFGIRRRAFDRQVRSQLAARGSLEASEERFRSLAETAQDAILLLDADGHLTYLNPAGMAMFGLRPQDLGRPAGHLLGERGNDPAGLIGTTELQAQRKDGSTFPAELSLARSERPGGAVYTGILRDVSERKHAEEATAAAASREVELETLRKMNSFKTQFLNTAAHELNTPLTPLRLQLHLLKAESMGPLNERQAKAVALLDRNVNRLSGLVGEILEVARLQSGRIRITPSAVEVDAVVDEVIESFNETARKVGVGLAFEGTPGLTVMADRNRCTQVLFNLVSNALKFTPTGGSVTISAGRRGDAVQVEVRDTGLGLTAEQIARLFQPFSQVHDPMAVPATGTGLGLYICKGLVEAQGGRIAVESPGPGRGSTFTFTLPVAAAAPPADAGARPPPAGEAPPDEDPMVRRLRELI